MKQWGIYETLKRNSPLSESEIIALEKDPAWIFREAVIEFLLTKARKEGDCY